MADFEVTRSTRIASPPQRIHGLIVDFEQWREWSPWEGLDPNVKRDYSGPEAGVGARYAWEGNRKVGKGSMALVDDKPERVEIDVIFEKPWKASNKAIFDLTPSGETTEVTWRMSGTNKGIAALFSRFFSMDRMVGKDFEKGLARLKVAAESRQRSAPGPIPS